MHLAASSTIRARIRLLVLLVAAVMAASQMAVAPVHASSRGDGLRAAANDHRLADGLDPVIGTALLDSIADARADQMASANSLQHDMTYVGDALKKAGVCLQGFGEIIASQSGIGTYSYDSVMNMWWKSAGHHAIIMTPEFNAAGGAWATASDGDFYSVMIFVELCPKEEKASVELLQPSRAYDARPMVFWPGSYTGLRFSASRDAIGSTSASFLTRSAFTSSGWALVNGHAYVKVSSGPLSGFWVRETTRSYVRGMTQKTVYDPQKRIAFAAGTYAGLTIARGGTVTSRTWVSLGSPSVFRASARAIINGRAWFKMSTGPLAGYWVRDTSVVNPA